MQVLRLGKRNNANLPTEEELTMQELRLTRSEIQEYEARHNQEKKEALLQKARLPDTLPSPRNIQRLDDSDEEEQDEEDFIEED